MMILPDRLRNDVGFVIVVVGSKNGGETKLKGGKGLD